MQIGNSLLLVRRKRIPLASLPQERILAGVDFFELIFTLLEIKTYRPVLRDFPSVSALCFGRA